MEEDKKRAVCSASRDGETGMEKEAGQRSSLNLFLSGLILASLQASATFR